MSLVSDFAHYYNGTWIAQKQGELNIPLFVTSVEQRGNFSSEDFSHEAELAMYFNCERWTRVDGQMRQQQIEIDVFDPTLILESPDVGYLQHSRNVVSWTHINPVRQRAKGLMGNKIRNAPVHGRSISGEMVYNLFNPEFEGLLTRYIFIEPNNGKVYYKGAIVGQVQMDVPRNQYGNLTVHLLDKFKHIISDFENYSVSLVESL